MKAELTITRNAAGEWYLLPSDEDDQETLRNLGMGPIVVNLKRNRNPKYHRYAFQMLRYLFEMSHDPGQFEPWRKWLTIKAGFVHTYGFPDGSVLVEPESLSWESMDEARFRLVWKDIHQTWCRIYGKKVTEEELMRWAMM